MFRMIQFRSMIKDAEKRLEQFQLEEKEEFLSNLSYGRCCTRRQRGN